MQPANLAAVMPSLEGNMKPGFWREPPAVFLEGSKAVVEASSNCLIRDGSALTLSVHLGMP